MEEIMQKILEKYKPEMDEEMEEEWKRRIKHVCKPCWELKYCPYGPLVEEFPLLSPIRSKAIEHIEFLKENLEKGVYDDDRIKLFTMQIDEFDPEKYPEAHSEIDKFMSCNIFGHQCPVFFVNEPFTETSEMRRITRHIPRAMLIRVVRRDNQTCQLCGKNLLESDIEIDHIIPFSKGGPTEEHNLRVLCIECNRKRQDEMEL